MAPATSPVGPICARRTVSAASGPTVAVAPVPTTTKTPTPSQILVLVFMSSPRCFGRARGIHILFYRAEKSSSNVLVFNHSNERKVRRPMQIVIGNVLPADEVATVRASLERADFVDGKATAGFAAREVKSNRQAEGSDRALETVRKLIAERILGNEVFRLAVRPKALTPLLFSRYEPGMQYGRHVDDALMDGLRTDVAFTLFL